MSNEHADLAVRALEMMKYQQLAYPLVDTPAQVTQIDAAIAVTKQAFEDAARYHELLMCVAKKYPGESRHDTAKRYLLDREMFGIGDAAMKEKP